MHCSLHIHGQIHYRASRGYNTLYFVKIYLYHPEVGYFPKAISDHDISDD